MTPTKKAKPPAAGGHASENAKAIIRRWNEEAWSGGKYDLAYEIISPNMVVHGAGGQTIGMGPHGLIDLVKTWRTAFPDGRMEIDDLIVEGDLVAIRNTWYGTHQADFYGVPGSGKQVAVTSIGLDRVQDGMVVEGWGELDMVGAMQSIGALPPVGPGAVARGKSPVWGERRASTAAAPPSSSVDNKTALVRLVEALASGDRDAAEEVVDRDAFVDHNPVWCTETFTSVIASYETLRRAMPDLRFQVEHANMVSEADQVAGHSLVTGTHIGEALYGAAPSGKQLMWTQSDFVRVTDGRVVERWVSADTLTLFQQAGVLPAPN